MSVEYSKLYTLLALWWYTACVYNFVSDCIHPFYKLEV